MQHHPGSWYLPWGVPLQKMVAVPIHHPGGPLHLQPPAVHVQPMLAGLPAPLATLRTFVAQPTMRQPQRKICGGNEKEKKLSGGTEKRKADDGEPNKDLKKAKLETSAESQNGLIHRRPIYNETSYYIENGTLKIFN
ncbi:uncharacterized protein [Atheta coriaria]|uniref:uncharacterized protein n=1 Tax=Dalotia coriaria TaxID=877792 RepID=UPI0031F3F371